MKRSDFSIGPLLAASKLGQVRKLPLSEVQPSPENDGIYHPTNSGWREVVNQAEPSLRQVIAPPGELALLSFQGKRANAIWTQLEFTVLCEHLHNNNADTHWIMGFRKDGKKYYKRSKQKPAYQGISWAWSTIVGKVKAGNELAFAPYSCNADGQSRWGAMDFDAHGGEADRARRLAFASFQALLNTAGVSLIAQPSTRNSQLCGLTGEMFFQVDARRSVNRRTP